MAPGQVDLRTIREQPSGLTKDAPLVKALMRKVTITSDGVPQAAVQFEGEDLYPCELSPMHGGPPENVEFRSGLTYEYRALPAPTDSSSRDRAAELEHARNMLRVLPGALQSSFAAMDAHSASSEVDMNTLGAIVLEQKRIREEIQAQTSKVRELEAAAQADRDPNRTMVAYKFQTSLMLPFGVTRIGGREYTIGMLPTNQTGVQPQNLMATLMLEPMQVEGQGR
jgi:hypothetical protein